MNGFKPYKRKPAHSDIALLHFDHGELYMEHEPYPFRSLTLDTVPASCVIYADRDELRALLRAGIGIATMRESSIVKLEYEGRTVFPLPRDVQVSFNDLCLWREWLESEGAGIGSRSGAAVKLLRSTIRKPFEYVGEPPNVEQIVGGRLHATPPKMHPNINVWDLRAAYAGTLAHLPSGRWIRNGTTSIEDESKPAIALVTIYIPERAKWGPLPQRDGIRTDGAWWEEWIVERPYPQRVTITGIWSSVEIRSALAHGAHIERVHAAWYLSVEDYPFLPWWDAVERGRKMPNGAGSLAKITGNTLWGVFATREGALHTLQYVNGKAIRETLAPKPLYHRNYPLAELITSSVRARVYDELILPAGDALISVCVDGGLVSPGFTPQGADWRLKDSGTLCSFLSPYLLMYARRDGTAVYKAAGVPESKRGSFFRSLQAHAQRKGRIALKMRQATEGSALDAALAEEAIAATFAIEKESERPPARRPAARAVLN